MEKKVIKLGNKNLENFQAFYAELKLQGQLTPGIIAVSSRIVGYLQNLRRNTELKEWIVAELIGLFDDQDMLFLSGNFLEGLARQDFLDPENLQRVKAAAEPKFAKLMAVTDEILVNTQGKLAHLLSELERKSSDAEKMARIEEFLKFINSPLTHYSVKIHLLQSIVILGRELPSELRSRVIASLSALKIAHPVVAEAVSEALVQIQTPRSNKK